MTTKSSSEDIKDIQKRLKRDAKAMSLDPADGTVHAAIKKLEDDIKHRPVKQQRSILYRIGKYLYQPRYAARMLTSAILTTVLLYGATIARVGWKLPQEYRNWGPLPPSKTREERNNEIDRIFKTNTTSKFLAVLAGTSDATTNLLIKAVLATQAARLLVKAGQWVRLDGKDASFYPTSSAKKRTLSGKKRRRVQ